MSSKRRKGRGKASADDELPPQAAVDEPAPEAEAGPGDAPAVEGPDPAGPGDAAQAEPQAGGGPDQGGQDAEGGAVAEVGEDEAAERPRRRRAQHPPPPPERLAGAVEALLLASGDALTPERMRDVLGLSSAIHVREAVEQVRQRWEAAGLSVELQEVAGGVRVVTRPEYAEYVRRLARHVVDGKLSQGQLETLSIIAYRQPVARPEIERIRGVQVGEALRALLERNLVKVVGRSDQPGRPMLYGTTRKFLTTFGLNDLKDLPSAKDLARL
ncbi:MAG: SMC-Scp complex subunit ScpB [Planctomycetia bacterium]